MHSTRTILTYWILNKSHSRDILTWCALLCPVPCFSPSPQGRACSGNYNRRIFKEIWLLLEFLPWFSREKRFSCLSPHLYPLKSTARSQHRTASWRGCRGEPEALKNRGKKRNRNARAVGFQRSGCFGQPLMARKEPSCREAAAGAPWRQSGAGAGFVQPPGSACTGIKYNMKTTC